MHTLFATIDKKKPERVIRVACSTHSHPNRVAEVIREFSARASREDLQTARIPRNPPRISEFISRLSPATQPITVFSRRTTRFLERPGPVPVSLLWSVCKLDSLCSKAQLPSGSGRPASFASQFVLPPSRSQPPRPASTWGPKTTNAAADGFVF